MADGGGRTSDEEEVAGNEWLVAGGRRGSSDECPESRVGVMSQSRLENAWL